MSGERQHDGTLEGIAVEVTVVGAARGGERVAVVGASSQYAVGSPAAAVSTWDEGVHVHTHVRFGCYVRVSCVLCLLAAVRWVWHLAENCC